MQAEIDRQVRRYVVLKTAVCVGVGVLIGLIFSLLQLDLAFLVGLITFAANFVPNVGAIFATLLPMPLILLDPAGHTFDQAAARDLADLDGFSLLCGRYEGVDERIRTELCDGGLSIGDVVLAGGELAALVVIEAVARLLPGVLGNEASVDEESFTSGLLEYPQYTRPREFRGMAVPDVLLSGDHAKVARWRQEQAELLTAQKRAAEQPATNSNRDGDSKKSN